MKLKIGVMGSHQSVLDQTIIKRSRELGREIARSRCILINGATTGLPDEAARGAKEEDGFVMGISPAVDEAEHTKKYKLPTKYYDTIVYTGFGFNLRNIVNIRTSDAIVFLRGSMGTLNEFTIAYEDCKIIGILEGCGGVSEVIDEIVEICKKNTGAKIVYEHDPAKLVKRLIAEVKKQNIPSSKKKFLE